MSASIHGSSCANHPDRAAIGNCANCGKPVCEPCSVEFVATEQTFCSERCRDAVPGQPGQVSASNATLETGLEKPIRTAWALASRSMGRIACTPCPSPSGRV